MHGSEDARNFCGFALVFVHSRSSVDLSWCRLVVRIFEGGFVISTNQLSISLFMSDFRTLVFGSFCALGFTT